MRTTALLAVGLALAACSTPVTAKRVGPERVYKKYSTNVLTARKTSELTELALHRANLTEAFDDDPRAALAELQRRAVEVDRRDRLFALAELSMLTARRYRDRDLYVASAVYAYLYLLGDAEDRFPIGFDRRFRVACDIYNRALVEAFRTEDDLWDPEGGVFRLPAGTVKIELPDDALRIGTQSFEEFRPSIDYRVQGMHGRLHQSGLGVALIAGGHEGVDSAPHEISERVRVAGTGFLEVLGELDAAEEPGLRAVLTLHTPKKTTRLQVRGRTIPLEVDATTPLAYSLRDSGLWDFELGGFMSPETAEFENGISLLSPYEPGKIPLVFVHGTASSPARWIELLNELGADDVLREHYRAWLFIYSTSGPILLSAKSLRDHITERVAVLDPEGTDEALSQMVVIGHSQGGLLTRLTVTHSEDHFWSPLSDRPFDELDLPAKEKEELRSAIFFEPVPYVSRVIFLCAPHRGSFLSEGLLKRIGNALITLPKRTLQFGSDIVTRNHDIFKPEALRGMPTAVDNMSPGDRFLVSLEKSPMAEGVPRHSIIAVTDMEPPLDERDDGVVAYKSAHLENVDSEKVVHSGHSAQGHPDTVLEVRRILREHLIELGRWKPEEKAGSE
jgi:pimeloyl-ACP methyl ester carboxylesterase